MKTDSKSVCFDVFNHIVKNHNTTHHNTIKIKLIDVKSNSYAEFNVGSNQKDPKFKIGDRVRISKYKNILLEDMLLIGQKKFLLLAKLKIQFHGLLPFCLFPKSRELSTFSI